MRKIPYNIAVFCNFIYCFSVYYDLLRFMNFVKYKIFLGKINSSYIRIILNRKVYVDKDTSVYLIYFYGYFKKSITTDI